MLEHLSLFSLFPSGSQRLEAKKKKDEEKRQVEEQAREEKVIYSMFPWFAVHIGKWASQEVVNNMP